MLKKLVFGFLGFLFLATAGDALFTEVQTNSAEATVVHMPTPDATKAASDDALIRRIAHLGKGEGRDYVLDEDELQYMNEAEVVRVNNFDKVGGRGIEIYRKTGRSMIYFSAHHKVEVLQVFVYDTKLYACSRDTLETEELECLRITYSQSDWLYFRISDHSMVLVEGGQITVIHYNNLHPAVMETP